MRIVLALNTAKPLPRRMETTQSRSYASQLAGYCRCVRNELSAMAMDSDAFYLPMDDQTLVGHPRTPWSVKFHPTNPRYVASGCLGFQVRCASPLFTCREFCSHHLHGCYADSGTLKQDAVCTWLRCVTLSSRSRSTRLGTFSPLPVAHVYTLGTTRYATTTVL